MAQGRAGVSEAPALARDHARLHDAFVARRYVAKFRAITGHLSRVAGEMEAARRLTRLEARVVSAYVAALARSFEALGCKYLMTGRLPETITGRLTFDTVESGFPVAQELMVMANDALQAEARLARTASEEALLDEMIREIVGGLAAPVRLQYALSQRRYHEALARGGLFLARLDPEAVWTGGDGAQAGGWGRDARRDYLLHWAVYDAEVNLPVLYLMEVSDTGRAALPLDPHRWPEAQAHLMAQALGSLHLVTIARGFDRDFDDLHPTRLRRFRLGPLHSRAFTRQSGPIAEVLAQADAPEGEDWALAWTEEELVSEGTLEEPRGLFGRVERQVYALGAPSPAPEALGATRLTRALILPQRPFQALAELDPPGFRDVERYVVSKDGRVLHER